MRAEPQPIEVVTRELDLRSGMPFLESEAQLQPLLAIARNVEFRRGERLFERGAPVASVFLITRGDVDLVAEHAPAWRISGSGGAGFLDFTIGRPHARTAIARTDVRAVEIDAVDYREYMQDHVDVAHLALANLSDALLGDILAAAEPAELLTRDPSLGWHPEGGEPTLVDRMILLARAPAFAGASVQALANLARGAALVRAPAGQVIAAAGARAEAVSVLVRGEVELTAPERGLAARRGAVDLVAHVAELSSAPRPIEARAVRDSLVLQIHREELLDRLDEHFELLESLIAYVSGQRERLNDARAAEGSTI